MKPRTHSLFRFCIWSIVGAIIAFRGEPVVAALCVVVAYLDLIEGNTRREKQ